MNRTCGSCHKIKIAPLLILILLLNMFLCPTYTSATIPLITDDTGTQGKGKSQLELFGAYGHDYEKGVTKDTSFLAATLSYGIIDSVDICLTVPYLFIHSEGSKATVKNDGFSDLAIEAKWRFYQKNGFSFAIKPGFTLPTGNEDKDLGNGKAAYYLYLITTKEVWPWTFSTNVVYVRNDNNSDNRKDLWHVSFAPTVEIMKGLKLVADVGVDSNPDRSSSTLPAYILGGLIYSVKENLDIGLGLKAGLTKPEPDFVVRGGITWRF